MGSIDSTQKSLTSNRILLSISFSLFFAWIYLSGWIPLVIQNIGGDKKYRDMESVLQAAECYKNVGEEVYSSTETCGYQYGLFLLKFINFFHLNSMNFEALGFAFFFVVTLIMVSVAVSTVRTRGQSVLAFFLVISPGPWLLFERGNFDLLIIILLSLSVPLINTKFSILSIVLIASTALMKFYTLPLLLLYFVFEKRKSLKLLVVVALLVLTPLILSDITSAPGFGNPLFVAFGLLAPGLWINFFAWRFDLPIELGSIALYTVGGLLFVFLFYIIFISSRWKLFSSYRIGQFVGSELQRVGFLFSSVVYISCFLAGMNYDYRLIFLIFALLLANDSLPEQIVGRWLIATQICALWSTFFFFGATGPIPVFLAILGNLCQLLLTLYLIGVVYRTLQISYGLSELIHAPVQWLRRKGY